MAKRSKLDQAADFWKANKLEDSLSLLKECERETNDQEDLAEIYMYKGWVLKDKEDYEIATGYFEKALELTTDSFVTAYSLQGFGSCMLHKDNYSRAIDFFKRACEVFETIRKYHKDGMWACSLLEIDTLLRVDKLHEAMLVKQRMEQKNPPLWFRARTSQSFGHFHYRHGDYGKGIQFYKEALKSAEGIKRRDEQDDEMKCETLGYLGCAFYKSGDRENGRSIIRQALPYIHDNELKKELERYLIT